MYTWVSVGKLWLSGGREARNAALDKPDVSWNVPISCTPSVCSPLRLRTDTCIVSSEINSDGFNGRKSGSLLRCILWIDHSAQFSAT